MTEKQHQAFKLSPYRLDWCQILFGPMNEHLRLIERHFSVTIFSQTDQLLITGTLEQRQKVHNLINGLYHHIQKHHALTVKDLHNAIQIATLSATDDASEASSTHPNSQQNTLEIGKRTVKLANKDQVNYLSAVSKNTITFSLGTAGTGKTFLAIACGLSYLMRGRVEKIILVRPVVDAGEKLGFLPGDLSEKVDPYLRPFYDELNHLLGKEVVDSLFEQKKIEIAPIAFMRGRTLNDAFIILDEAQNTNIEQMKMLLTRIGHGSKMTIAGDLTQCDLPSGIVSGLEFAHQSLQDIKDIDQVHFSLDFNMRHPLIPKILAALDTHKKKRRL